MKDLKSFSHAYSNKQEIPSDFGEQKFVVPISNRPLNKNNIHICCGLLIFYLKTLYNGAIIKNNSK